VIDQFKREVEKQSLCATVGRVMFCPKCENLMNWKSSVEFSVWEVSTGKCLTVRAICAPCWDTVQSMVTKPSIKYRVDTIDGRKLK